jgi:hypothetical protein
VQGYIVTPRLRHVGDGQHSSLAAQHRPSWMVVVVKTRCETPSRRSSFPGRVTRNSTITKFCRVRTAAGTGRNVHDLCAHAGEAGISVYVMSFGSALTDSTANIAQHGGARRIVEICDARRDARTRWE